MRLTRCAPDAAHGRAVTYGQYFEGITDVISKDGYRLLIDATASQLAEDVSLSDIEEILIYAEKHGSDYHPARIEVRLHDVCASFVMNVAITTRGKTRLYPEFAVLQHLNSKHGFPFLPTVYFQDEALPPSMLMFLADWFQGYHEFHLSMDEDGSEKLVLWDTEKNLRHLSRSQAWQIYSQAARILTLYYDIETFEQIFPWHHAAGDFVVKRHPHPNPPPSRGRAGWGWIDVRLVTARQYAPMLERSEGVSVHEALLLFLLNLSVRMRLDRLDGVGAVAWADDECLGATLEGFVKALRIKEGQGRIERGFVDRFLRHLRSLCRKDLSDRFLALITACDPSAPDMPVIRTHLEGHVRELHTALHKFRLGDFSH
jgi:hypothetical protein